MLVLPLYGGRTGGWKDNIIGVVIDGAANMMGTLYRAVTRIITVSD